MPGSKTKVIPVLLYNNQLDIAEWVLPSMARTMENISPVHEVIDESMDNYQAVAKLAGPMPEVYHQEVVMPTKE